MKLNNLENKYDDLQNKIDYIINRQNALAESFLRKKGKGIIKENNQLKELINNQDNNNQLQNLALYNNTTGDNNQLTRISQINNRVATLIANYSTYINNKTFNT